MAASSVLTPDSPASPSSPAVKVLHQRKWLPHYVTETHDVWVNTLPKVKLSACNEAEARRLIAKTDGPAQVYSHRIHSKQVLICGRR